MWALLSMIAVIVLFFFVPALYTAALVLLESIFGESIYLHLAVFAVFILSALYSVYNFIKNKPDREGRTDETEDEDNNW